jgi:hypothetical protein
VTDERGGGMKGIPQGLQERTREFAGESVT